MCHEQESQFLLAVTKNDTILENSTKTETHRFRIQRNKIKYMGKYFFKNEKKTLKMELTSEKRIEL